MNSHRLKRSIALLLVRLEEYYSERRERKQDRMLLALPGQRFGGQAACFPYYRRHNRSSHCSATLGKILARGHPRDSLHAAQA